MCSILRVLLLAILLFGCSCLSSLSLPMFISNGTSNEVVSVETDVGRADVGPGVTMRWWTAESGTNLFFTNGAFAGGWNSLNGHDYTVFAGAAGVAVHDNTPSSTRWFWFGFSTSLFIGLLSLRFRVIRSGINE